MVATDEALVKAGALAAKGAVLVGPVLVGPYWLGRCWMAVTGAKAGGATGGVELVGDGDDAASMVTVKTCEASGLFPLLAFTVNVVVPALVGVPDRTAVPSPLSTKLSPAAASPPR